MRVNPNLPYILSDQECRRLARRDAERDRTLKRGLALLRLLATKGPLNQYGILQHSPRESGSKPVVLETIKRLVNDRLIETDHVNEDARGFTGTSKYYKLTLPGLLQLIGNLTTDKDRKLLGFFATKYRDLTDKNARLFLLDLWPNIEATGIRDAVARALVGDCHRALVEGHSPPPKWLSYRALLHPALELDNISGGWPLRKGAKEYLQRLQKDKKLRAIMLEQLRLTSSLLQSRTKDLMRRNDEMDLIIASMQSEPPN